MSSRIALGLVWLYEGLAPKVPFLRTDEMELVQKSHLVWRTPQLTLQLMGITQVVVGIWLIAGFAGRAAVFIATAWMLILIALVAGGNPSMLTDPYGALVKDLCLIACAITVWTLAEKELSPAKTFVPIRQNRRANRSRHCARTDPRWKYAGN